MEKGLLEKTGHDLAHWIKVVKASGLDKHKAMMDFLKSTHGFTHGFANFVVLKAREADAASANPEDLITNQYQGKEQLKPIYDALMHAITALGDDVQVKPKKDSVSLVRKFQFVLIKPATKKRIDLGLKLKGKETTERLENSGPFGAMCTHRVQLFETADVDKQLLAWIQEAYDKSV